MHQKIIVASGCAIDQLAVWENTISFDKPILNMENRVIREIADEQAASYLNRRTFALILLPSLAIFLNWPYLLAGFSGDDVIFLNILQQDPLPFSRQLGMWSISASYWSFLDHIWWKDWTSAGSSSRATYRRNNNETRRQKYHDTH